MAKVYDVANSFLERDNMTHVKLQKLVYYFAAWGWALYDRKMIEDTEFEADAHGPISKKLYRKYRKYGWGYIDRIDSYKLTEEEQKLSDAVWDTYGELSGTELEFLSQSEVPWIKAKTLMFHQDMKNARIEPEDMKEYYSMIKNKECQL